ncbi:hypothetical protein AX16_003481 [Volvariella volvacea WC 439]|nr:hypothetical protein AX16_003481 [Volvariella volvacea WC 439]
MADPKQPPVESAVTRLLVSIKQLLESLTSWSLQNCDETHVSDVYVRLGNDFNAAVAAFGAFGIDMSELMSVPNDLRNVLEQCLAEDATPENLEIYLPEVRQIITGLLNGLRTKQTLYRRVVSERNRTEAAISDRDPANTERSERASRGSRRDGHHRSQSSRSQPDGTAYPPNEVPDSISRRSAQSIRRREPQSEQYSNGDGFVGGFTTQINGQQSFQQPQAQPQDRLGSMPEPQFGGPYGSPPPPPPPPPPAIPSSPPVPPNQPLDSNPPSISAPIVPPGVKRYSLVDAPVVVVEPSAPQVPDIRADAASPPPPDGPPQAETPPPAVASSLAALKGDVLERRASKRFSTFQMSKMMGGGTSRERSVRSANRRSLAPGTALTPGDLAVLTEADEENAGSPVRRKGSGRGRRSISRAATPEAQPPVPPLPTNLPESTASSPVPPPVVPPDAEEPPSEPPAPPEPSKLRVYLQLGKEVKKVSIEPPLSFSALRVLFVDKFSYNPGLENFPAIYIRDPSSGVQYELEDIDEVTSGCLLSLNIEPLDQIKQHIDSQISSLSQELKDLKTAVANANRAPAPPPIVALPLPESTPPPRPTDKQFVTVARRLSRFVSSNTASPLSFENTPPPFVQPQMTGQSLQPQMTGGSMLSDYSSRVVSDLKTQFDEVQNLRRDLGVMRQLYMEFMKDTKTSLTKLRTQTATVKQLANSRVGGARSYIDDGKKKLDIRSQNVLTEVEKLQDVVEGIKDDVIKRHITPKPLHVKQIKKDMDSVAAELESLKEHMKTIKPMWKKTWEEELQNIVEEQQFLTHQEEFLADLLEDHKAVVEVYGHVEKVISLRGTSVGGKGRMYRPPPPEEGHGGLSTVMMEIRGASVDPAKRMKAIEASQKNREKEKAGQTDELQMEITDFVKGGKLKKTGGAEEAERVRQKKNEMTLKAMFNSSNSNLNGSNMGVGGVPVGMISPQPTGSGSAVSSPAASTATLVPSEQSEAGDGEEENQESKSRAATPTPGQN